VLLAGGDREDGAGDPRGVKWHREAPHVGLGRLAGLGAVGGGRGLPDSGADQELARGQGDEGGDLGGIGGVPLAAGRKDMGSGGRQGAGGGVADAAAGADDEGSLDDEAATDFGRAPDLYLRTRLLRPR